VTFKGQTKIAPPAAYPAKMDLALFGELEMHGKKFPETINVHVEMASATSWHVTGTFDVSLDKYQVERPALLLKKIDDACHMTLDLTLLGAAP
jgi:polyisoprenoid-binding protein YceI